MGREWRWGGGFLGTTLSKQIQTSRRVKAQGVQSNHKKQGWQDADLLAGCGFLAGKLNEEQIGSFNVDVKRGTGREVEGRWWVQESPPNSWT
eukprot:602694-Pelagomonas_calceolata.AAC.4